MSNKTNSRLTGVLLQEWNILNIENIRHCLQNLALTSPEFKTFTQSWPLGSRPIWKAKSSWPMHYDYSAMHSVKFKSDFADFLSVVCR